MMGFQRAINSRVDMAFSSSNTEGPLGTGAATIGRSREICGFTTGAGAGRLSCDRPSSARAATPAKDSAARLRRGNAGNFGAVAADATEVRLTRELRIAILDGQTGSLDTRYLLISNPAACPIKVL